MAGVDWGWGTPVELPVCPALCLACVQGPLHGSLVCSLQEPYDRYLCLSPDRSLLLSSFLSQCCRGTNGSYVFHRVSIPWYGLESTASPHYGRATKSLMTDMET